MWRARQARHFTTYGSPRWAEPREIRRAGLFGDAGVFLGSLCGCRLRHDCPEYVVAFLETTERSFVGVEMQPTESTSCFDGSGSRDERNSDFVTADEFACLARLSRRQIDRLRKARPQGFPREYEFGSGLSKFRRCPRIRRSEVDSWLDSRALW
jgi:predicted DNA-binding transcriptional regulator AlpA